jgi:enoyl-CoA hydratase/carnithine racemase
MTDAFSSIRLEVDAGVATITLDRPDKLNAFDTTMMEELIAAFDATDADDRVRAVVVTGSGNRAFCAGLDLSGGAEAFSFDAEPDGVERDIGGRLTLRIFNSVKPVIAAVNGAAIGIGATMLLAMDIRLAANTARFGFVFTRRGITPEAASSWFLPRVVGIQTALAWCYSGRLVAADEAFQRDLVFSVHEPDRLLDAAHALAREIAANTSPVATALTRQMMWRMLGAGHPMDAHRVDSRAVQSRGRSADADEGVQAFLQKRPADFPDAVSRDMPPFFPWWREPAFE